MADASNRNRELASVAPTSAPLVHHRGVTQPFDVVLSMTAVVGDRYNPSMLQGEDKSRRWRLGTRDLLWLTTAIAVGLGSIRYAATNSVSTFPQFLILLTGWFTLGGCVGASLWWLRYGTNTNITDGFVLGVILAGPALLLYPIFIR